MKLPQTTRIQTFNGGNRINALIAAVVVIAVGVVGTVMLATHAAGVGVLSLTPATANVSLGSNVVVTITENSSTTSVNAIEADLTYDQTKLQFVSIDTSTSPFNGLVARATGGGGTVFVANGTTTPTTGSQIVAKVTFTAIGTGSTSINFAATSGIAESTNNTDILGTMTGATYTISDTTAPSVPTTVTKTGATATSVSLSWTGSTDNVAVTGYKIYRGGTQVGTSATTTFTNTGLAPSNTYSFTVAANDAAGNTSAQSTALSAATTADTTAPSVPGAPTMTTRTLSSISLSWTASTDNVAVTGYKIYRGGTQIGTSATTSYTDSGLTANTSYSYTIAANDAAGNTSAQSTAAPFSTLADTTAPTVPTGLTSPSQTTTTVNLSWTASTDNVAVTGYKIYRGGVQIGTSATASYTDSGLTSGTQYSYTVAAYDAAGNTSAQTGALLVTAILVPGDANSDGHVTFLDLSILSATWQGTTDLRADFNNDGVVNFLDLSIMASNWGK
ncbi:MAG: fibronectin type III domain-containing protein [Candidatus Saccharimonadales bacterium]